MESAWIMTIVASTLIWIVSGNISCDYPAMTEFLQGLAANYTATAKLVSIGETEEHRAIWTMIVSDSPNKRPLLRPQVKFVGNVNGMSGPACYILLRLTKHLLEEYRNEGSMERKLMENMEIHIIPNLNPDGYAKAVPGSCYGKEGRVNANNFNLNANFPDIFMDGDGPPIQKETEAMMRWMEEHKFIISVSLISGAQVVVYPFDSIIEDEYAYNRHDEPHLTPDDDIFKHLSMKYSQKTGTPEQGWHCPLLERTFPHGIINGAQWKPTHGTMMDYNYIQGTFEITAGILCCRNEDNATVLDNLWWRHREGLLHVIHEVDGGIRGQVLDSDTYDPVPGAKLVRKQLGFLEDDVFGIPFSTTAEGEFWRPWRPGKYKLRVENEGYKAKDIFVDVHRHQPTFLRVELEKIEPATSPKTNAISRSSQDENQDNPVPVSNGEDATYSSTVSPAGADKSDDSFAQEVTNTKQFSSLTQLDHSLINLFRGVQFRSSSSARCSSSTGLIAVILVFVLATRHSWLL